MKANGVELTVKNYVRFKHEDNYYKSIDIYKFERNYRHQTNQYINPKNKYLNLTYSIPMLVSKDSGTKTLINSLVQFKRRL